MRDRGLSFPGEGEAVVAPIALQEDEPVRLCAAIASFLCRTRMAAMQQKPWPACCHSVRMHAKHVIPLHVMLLHEQLALTVWLQQKKR